MSDRSNYDNTSSHSTRLKESLPQAEPHLAALVRQRILQPMSAVRVANTVTFVNPDLAHTGFTTGSSSEFVCQIAMGSRKKTPDRIVYVRPSHNRSVIISATAHTTVDNQTFPYLDAKGTGRTEDIDRNPSHPQEHKYETYARAIKNYPDTAKPEKTWGLATRAWLKNEMDTSREIHRLGIRTIPLASIADLAEVLDPNGEKLSIEQAKAQGYLAQATEPAIIFRGWITPFRLLEVSDQPDDYKKFGQTMTDLTVERKRSILKTAFEDMKHDTSIPAEVRNSFPQVDLYLKWIATSIGKDLGTMHAKHITHDFLYSLHNITLDGRLVDFGTIKTKPITDRIALEKDSLLQPDNLYHSGFLTTVPYLFNSHINPRDLLHMTEDAYAHALATTPKS